MDNGSFNKRLLVFNCHEAWVYQLGCLGYDLDIIVGLKGQYKKTWDRQMRPVPPNARLITLEQALKTDQQYDCIIANNMADLLDVKLLTGPRIIVIHSTIEGRKIEEKSNIEPRQMKNVLRQYLDIVRGHAVAVSLLKGRSWNYTEDIIPFCADPDDYLPFTGQIPKGLRISNFIKNKKTILLWDFQQEALKDLDIKLVGHNPDMPDVNAADSWDHLKKMLQSHRFYIHTADPCLEDGYNMSTIEAMAAGLPVLGNKHPGSPIIHGHSGFLSDDTQELNHYAKMLIKDRNLAVRMGKNAQQTVREHFSVKKFRNAFIKAIETARLKWQSLPAEKPVFVKDQ